MGAVGLRPSLGRPQVRGVPLGGQSQAEVSKRRVASDVGQLILNVNGSIRLDDYWINDLQNDNK